MMHLPLFQSTLPRGVRRRSKCHRGSGQGFQSTHPRGVRQLVFDGDSITIQFSIHTPTRGATFLSIETVENRIFSIHAPTRGATRTPRQRARFTTFSIHTPTRGATTHVHGVNNVAGFSVHTPARVRRNFRKLGESH